MITIPNATETMAERAWRYGEQGVTHWEGGDRRCYFSDGSRLSRRGVEDARAVREAYEWLDHLAARLGGWERIE